MGFWSSLIGGGVKEAGEGVKATLDGIGGLANDLRSALTGDISPDKVAELQKKALDIQAKAGEGTMAINLAEASHRSIFVAGWRPAIGWVCAISLGFYFIPQYIVATILWTRACWMSGNLQPYPVTAEGLLQLVGALLGLALYRTVEKIKGVSK